jgi:glyoxylase I family protein
MEIEFTGQTPLLQVFDMPTSVAFYRDRLGFEVVQQAGAGDDVDWIWLRKNDSDLMLNTAYERDERPPRPDPARIAAHADVTLFYGCRDADALHRALRERGVECGPPTVAPYGMKQLTVRDPDGYLLCFQHRV